MKKLTAAFSVLLLLCAAGGMAAANANPGSAYNRVMHAGTLRCGYISGPPYFTHDAKTGDVSGIWAELVQELGKRLALKIDWVRETDPADALDELAAGRFDALCTGFLQTSSRARRSSFTLPFYYDALYIVARAGDKRFDEKPDAVNDPAIRVYARRATVQQYIAADNFPRAKLIVSPADEGNDEHFLQVAEGHADATLSTLKNFRAFADTHPGRLKIVPGKPIWTGKAGIAVAPGEPELWQMLNGGVEALNDSGFTRGVLNRYGGGTSVGEHR